METTIVCWGNIGILFGECWQYVAGFMGRCREDLSTLYRLLEANVEKTCLGILLYGQGGRFRKNYQHKGHGQIAGQLCKVLLRTSAPEIRMETQRVGFPA